MSKIKMPSNYGDKYICYSYDEVDEILIETETYKKKMKDFDDFCQNGLGIFPESACEEIFDKSYWEFKKCSLIDGMIEEKKLKSYHDREKDKFMWFLC